MDEVDAVVVGAGVVGLAVAREFALRGVQTLILEAADRLGTGVSARSSEVIHAGIYYPCGSLKARLCVAGRERLYGFARKRGVAHQRCGKLIVATEEGQLAQLKQLQLSAAANGVELGLLSAEEARQLEPQVACEAALHSPLTGIIDSQGLMLALLAEAEANGATLSTRSAVTRVVAESAALALGVNGCEPALRARHLINCAGLGASALAAATEGLPQRCVPQMHLCKGSYFALSGRGPFRRLIYPLPQPGGLGIHLTLDLQGQTRFGPDVQWVTQEDYQVDEGRAALFEAAVRAYWPALPAGALRPAYAGLRPKLAAAGEPAADFRIDDAARHGVPGLVNLFGIESPGLTASLALAGEAVSRVLGSGSQGPAQPVRAPST